ncbi:MAG: hypothetical protein R3E96_05480 [Planctomycetota bacterium]
MPAAKKACQPTVDCNGKACDGAACAEMDCASKAQKAASTDCCAGKAQGAVQGAGGSCRECARRERGPGREESPTDRRLQRRRLR